MTARDRSTLAFLHVLRHAVLFVRMRSEGPHRLPDEHLFDLMDAIHNVPEYLAGSNGYFTADNLRDHYFAPYDEKWGKESLGLVRLLAEGISEASGNV